LEIKVGVFTTSLDVRGVPHKSFAIGVGFT